MRAEASATTLAMEIPTALLALDVSRPAAWTCPTNAFAQRRPQPVPPRTVVRAGLFLWPCAVATLALQPRFVALVQERIARAPPQG